MATRKSPISTSYDKNAEVPDVSFGTGEPSYGKEVSDLIFFEAGMFSHRPTGFQIIGSRKQPRKKNPQLELERLLRSARSDMNKLLAA